MGDGLTNTCRCGNPAVEGEELCARCRYYKSVFKPRPAEFESKRDVALRAIANRKELRGIGKILVMEE